MNIKWNITKSTFQIESKVWDKKQLLKHLKFNRTIIYKLQVLKNLNLIKSDF
jgi:hypothetical protein